MAKKTINQALKDLFLGLGGDSSALEDNSSVSDYIADLESAIKACASGSSEDLIDDTEASENKTYSSSKIESITGSTYSETVIYDGFAEVGDTVTLSDSVENYDAVIIGKGYANPDTGDSYNLFSPYLPTRSLIGIAYKLPVARSSSSDTVMEFEFKSATTLYSDTHALNKVIGIKF